MLTKKNKENHLHHVYTAIAVWKQCLSQSKYESLQIMSRKKNTSDLNIVSSICITKQNKKVCFKTLFATINHGFRGSVSVCFYCGMF